MQRASQFSLWSALLLVCGAGAVVLQLSGAWPGQVASLSLVVIACVATLSWLRTGVTTLPELQLPHVTVAWALVVMVASRRIDSTSWSPGESWLALLATVSIAVTVVAVLKRALVNRRMRARGEHAVGGAS